MGRFATTLFIALLAALAAVPSAAQIDAAPKVHARLIAEQASVRAGETVTVALEETIRDGWHTYWLNPGDAGAPTEIAWALPPGWHAGAIAWPYPKRLPVGPLMDYGYEGSPWLLVRLTAPKNAPPGPATLKAAVSWLVCKEVCIPEDATVSLPFHVSMQMANPDPATEAAFAAARAKLPVASPWPMRYRLTQTLDLFVDAPALAKARPVDAAFFPARPGEIKGAKAQALGFARDGIALRLAQSPKFSAGGTLAGVLVLTSPDKSVQALTVAASPGFVPETEFGNESETTIFAALALAFLGGVLLNLMPCVLPILAIKALALVGQGGQARGESFAYAGGAIASFAAFGLALVILRQGGAAIGWGFQLQEPIVVAGFALLMFAVGLNLSGVYTIAPVTAGEALTRRSGVLGAFFTGVLAVGVAAPCTAPFMATALGFALTQATPVALAVFVALGLGFAAPFLVFGIWPALQRLLPKPGRWMATLQQILAFPMYGAAIWLVWVLALQTTAEAVAVTLAAMLVLAFALWLWTATRMLERRGRALGGLASIIALLGSLSLLAMLESGAASARPRQAVALRIPSEPYSAARLDKLRAIHHGVFVDATAAWCITCLVNEEAVLDRPAIRDAFAREHVVFLIADWTNRNREIAALLEANGRSGVPLYLYYAPDATTPVVLPQILTESAVLGALRG